MWVIDHPGIIYLPLICAALALGAAWWVTRRRQFLIGLLIVTGLGLLFHVLTLTIDTDRKQIERSLLAMAAGLKGRPQDKVFAHISDQFLSSLMVNNSTVSWGKAELTEAAKKASRDFDLEGNVIKEMEFKSLSDSESVVTFTARPLVGKNYFTLACPCEARFVRESDGQWRMRQLKVFNPFVNTTEPLNIPL